jgi:hypothetical protein
MFDVETFCVTIRYLSTYICMKKKNMAFNEFWISVKLGIKTENYEKTTYVSVLRIFMFSFTQ